MKVSYSWIVCYTVYARWILNLWPSLLPSSSCSVVKGFWPWIGGLQQESEPNQLGACLQGDNLGTELDGQLHTSVGNHVCQGWMEVDMMKTPRQYHTRSSVVASRDIMKYCHQL